jgi:hypothetical protein
VWMPAPTYDPIHGRIEAFYTDSERFRALCSENEATKVYAQTGIRIAQSAFHARRFVGRVTAHRAGAHKSEPEPKCYVCKNGGKS